jgi:multiple antibiotic resistance protein
MSLLSIAFSLFLLMNSIGNVPFYITLLKGVDPRRQRYVITREMLIALFIIILFSFIGNGLMHFLHITHDTIQIAGGVILFLLSLKMVFPPPHDPRDVAPHDTEPLIVPLAVPLIAGPAVLAAVMIYSQQQENSLVMIGAIFIAWAASLVILLSSSLLKNILGWRGIIAMERLMGLVMILIAVQMFLGGISSFVHKQHLTGVYSMGDGR